MMIGKPPATSRRAHRLACASLLFCQLAFITPDSTLAKTPAGEIPESAPTAGVGQAGRLGTAGFIASGTNEATVVATRFIIGKYQATEVQRQVAEERARRVIREMPREKKKTMKAKKIRYIAVDTQKDRRIKGKKAIMLWDTEASQLVGNAVYDVATPPPLTSQAKFETYSAQYVGEGIN